MFNPVKETAKNAKEVATISGGKGGVRVLCEDQAVLSKYNELAALARNGNYWAHQVVSGIYGLSSGRLGKNNVFVRQGTGPVYGVGAFYVVLPGVTATLEQHSGGHMVLMALTADKSYQRLQGQGEKPSFWKATSRAEGWDVNHLSAGKTSELKESAFVAISDKHETPQEAVIDCAKGLEGINSVVESIINAPAGFAMHFTPGKGKIGGLRNCLQAMNAHNHASLNESAILLAQTMHKAQSVPNIKWMSDAGGSGVLTQAMQILADNNVQLNKHTVYLNHPTTRPSTVTNLARRLGLKPAEYKKGATPDELVGRMLFLDGPISKVQRVRSDDSYGGTNLATDASKQAGKWGLFGLGAAGAASAFGLVTIGAPVATAMGVAGGAVFVATALNKSIKSVAPKTHNKVMSKFK